MAGKILTMRIMSKGQVTIPKDLRDRCRLYPHTEVEFVLDGEGVRIIPASAFPGRGQALSITSAAIGRRAHWRPTRSWNLPVAMQMTAMAAMILVDSNILIDPQVAAA